MLERRRHDRGRDFASGTIAGGFDREAVACVVRNVSESGALLLLDEPSRAPVELTLAARGRTRPARIVWRGETGVGVAFAAPVTAAPSRPGSVVSLDEARRARGATDDGRRLAERIARFVRPARRPAAD